MLFRSSKPVTESKPVPKKRTWSDVLREAEQRVKQKITEGGNLASHDPTGKPTVGYVGIPGKYSAQKVDAKNRAAMQPVVKQLLLDINNVFARQYDRPIWDAGAINGQVEEFISGSSKWFMFLRQPNPKFDPKQPVSDANPKEIGITDRSEEHTSELQSH